MENEIWDGGLDKDNVNSRNIIIDYKKAAKASMNKKTIKRVDQFCWVRKWHFVIQILNKLFL